MENNIIIFLWLLLVLSLPQINGKPAYIVLLESIVCTVNPVYANPPNCSLDASVYPPRGYIDIQMHRETKTMQFELKFEITSNNRSRTLVHLKNQDQCAYFENRVAAVVKIIKQIIEDYGKFPTKCPVKQDFRYLFKDISVDSEKLPPFMIEGGFKITTRHTEGKDLVYLSIVKGKIARNYGIKNKDKAEQS